MSTSRRSSRSTYRSSPSSSSTATTSLPLRQPRWRTTLAGTAGTTAGTSYISAESDFGSDLGTRGAKDVLKDSLGAAVKDHSKDDTESDRDKVEMLKERLPALEVTMQEEPVRFGVDDSTVVGGTVGTEHVEDPSSTTTGVVDLTVSDSPISLAPSPTAAPEVVPAEPSTATTLTTAAPFPAETNHSNPSLPVLQSSTNPTEPFHLPASTSTLTSSTAPVKKSSTSWLSSFSRTGGKHSRASSMSASGAQSPAQKANDTSAEAGEVKVERIELPFPTPVERAGPLPATAETETMAEGQSTPTSVISAPAPAGRGTHALVNVEEAKESTQSLPVPVSSTTSSSITTTTTLAAGLGHTLSTPTPSPSPTPIPSKQHQSVRKPRSWFSSSPIASSPLASSPPIPGRRIAAAARGVRKSTSKESEDGAGSTVVAGTSAGSGSENGRDEGAEGRKDAEEAGTQTEQVKAQAPPMVHTISIDDAVPKLVVDSSETQASTAFTGQALSPPMVGAVPTTSRFAFGIPLLGRGRAGTASSAASAASRNGSREPTVKEVRAGAGATTEVKDMKEGDKGEKGENEGEGLKKAEGARLEAQEARPAETVGGDDVKEPEKDEEGATSMSQHSSIRSAPDSSTQTAQATEQAPNSWWGLIGWTTAPIQTSSSSPSAIAPDSNTSQSIDIDQNRDSSDDDTKSCDTAEAASSGSTGVQIDNEVAKDTLTESAIAATCDSDNTTKNNTGDRGSSELATDRQKVDSERENEASATSTWLSPWAWYAYSSNTITEVEVKQPESDVGTANVNPAEGTISGALAVGDSSIGESGKDGEVPNETNNETAPREPKRATEPSELNPIQSTIESNRSGWASFFTSRSLVVKTLGYTSAGSSVKDMKRDDDGNEIMDLDESEDEDPTPSRGRNNQVVNSDASRSPTKSTRPGSVKEGSASDVALSDGNPPATPEQKGGRGKQPTAPPLTISEGIRRETVQSNPANKVASSSKTLKPGSGSSTPASSPPASKRTASPAPSAKKAASPPPPNLVLPTWQDTFHTPPRNYVPPRSTPSERDAGVTGKLYGKTMKFVNGILFAKDEGVSSRKGKEKEHKEPLPEKFRNYGLELPRAWHVVEEAERAAHGGKAPSSGRAAGKGSSSEEAAEIEGMSDVLKGCKRVVVIGVHGWFPGAMMRTVLGEPTGTSGKFVSMMVQAIDDFATSHGLQFEKVTTIPLEGEGTISHRVEKLYTNLKSKDEWMDDLHAADAIFVATHSQGSVVSTHLLDCLIRDRHIRTATNSTVVGSMEPFPSAAGSSILPTPKPQRVCCLALCGIHLGPLRYLSSSSLLQPYIQYFESAAARELFEFQNTKSDVSKAYVCALENVLANGTKMVYVASLNDQVVPIYSGLFTAASHPLILRALYIDGDAYHSSDFLSNLLVLVLRILNTNISDSGLLAHLSEATAGSLNGVGHSTAYEELATYSLAVKYLFLTNDGLTDHPNLAVEPFDAMQEQNDYEIPWALRDVIADERVAHFFGREIMELRDAFREWHPKTAILRDLKRKLQPIQRLPASFTAVQNSASKL